MKALFRAYHSLFVLIKIDYGFSIELPSLLFLALFLYGNNAFSQVVPPKDSTKRSPSPDTSRATNAGNTASAYEYTGKIIPGSPNVAAIDKFVDIPVNNYTGNPNISVPLYSIKTRDLELPISIDYHGSGTKVEEESSSIGLGWALNAGGVIRHQVRGQDDFRSGNFYADRWRYLNKNVAANLPAICYYFENPNAVFFIPNTSTEGKVLDQELHTMYSTADAWGQPDSERDIFSYSFPGYSGKFLIEPLSNNQYVIRQMPQTDLRIDLSKNQQGNIDITGQSGFVIITPDGTRYTFGKIESQQARTGNQPRDTGKKYSISGLNPLYNDGQQFSSWSVHAGAWYLTEIQSQKGDIIKLTYDETANYINALPVRTETYTTSYATGFRWNVNESANKLVYLKSVEFDNGTASFFNDSREDLPTGSLRLDRLEVRTKLGNLIKNIKFTQDYFNSNSGRLALVSKRLKLLSVQDITVPGCMPPYNFTYEQSVNLPDKDSYAQDYFGFFNGEALNDDRATMLPNIEVGRYKLPFPAANRNPNTNYLRANVLLQITYPTGGTTTFDWNPHEVTNLVYNVAQRPYLSVSRFNTNNNLYGGGLRINKISVNSNNGSPQITKYEYGLGGKLMAGLQFADWIYVGPSDMQLQFTSSPRYPLGSGAQGNPIGYSEVTVYKGSDKSSEGYSRYYYHNGIDERAADFCIQGIYDPFNCSVKPGLSPNYTNCDPYGRAQISNYEGVTNTSIPNHNEPLNGYLFQEDTFNNLNSLVKRISTSYEIKNLNRIKNFKATKRSDIYSGFIYYEDSYLPRIVDKKIDDYGAGANLSLFTSNTITYGYNVSNAYIQPKQIRTVDNSGEVTETNYIYAADSPSSSVTSEMIYRNIVSIPLFESNELINKEGARTQIQSSRTNFKFWHNSFIAPETIESKIGNGPFIREVTLDYNLDGNLVATTDKTDIKTNFSYFSDAGKKALLQSKNVSVNGLLAQEIKYNYIPLVGVSSITDVNGFVTSYSYDGLNRLSTIKDQAGNLLESNTYRLVNSGGCNTPQLATEQPISYSLSTTSSCTGTGSLSYERWDGINGSDVSDLLSSLKYTGPANYTATLNSFEIPLRAFNQDNNNYGARLRGYICPPKTGQYTFWISGDNGVSLRLNSNGEDPTGAIEIARNSGYTGVRQWNASATQKSALVQLSAGRKYYVEAILKEQDGDDHLAVGWRIPGEDQSILPTAPINGKYLIPFSSTVVSGTTATGCYNIQNIQSGALAQAMPNNSVLMQSKGNGLNQVWQLVPITGQANVFKVVSQSSTEQKVISVQSTSDAQPMYLSTYANDANHQWYFEQVSTAADGKVYRVSSNNKTWDQNNYGNNPELQIYGDKAGVADLGYRLFKLIPATCPATSCSLVATATPASLSAGTSTTLTVACSGCGTSTITGGGNVVYSTDFNNDIANSTFQTDYSDQAKVLAVGPNTDGSYCAIVDHTGNNGKVLQFHGEPQGRIWSKEISVTSGTTYTFSMWVRPVFNGSPATQQRSVQLKVDGNTIATPIVDMANAGCTKQWTLISGSWTATRTGSIPFVLQSGNSSWQNAFTIDDIKITAGTGGTAPDPTSNQYVWKANGQQIGTGSSLVVTPTASTTYTVDCSTCSGCTSATTVVTVSTSTTVSFQRVLVIGNSITKIPSQPTMGWTSPELDNTPGGWGMAASKPGNDFVHILESYFKGLNQNAKVVGFYEADFERENGNYYQAGWPTFNYSSFQNRINNAFSIVVPKTWTGRIT